MNQYLFACSLCLFSSSVFAELNVQETNLNIAQSTDIATQQEVVGVTTVDTDSVVETNELGQSIVAVQDQTEQPVDMIPPVEVVTPQTTVHPLEQSFESAQQNQVSQAKVEIAKPATETTASDSKTKRLLGLTYAQDSKPFILFAEGGIFGFGGGVGFSPNEYVDLTASFNKGSWHNVDFASLELANGTKYNVDIDTDVKSFYANIRPFAGKFHITVGMVNQNNKFKGSIEPNEDNDIGLNVGGVDIIDGPEYVFNDATFDANTVGKVYGSLQYEKKTMPYVGIGWSPALTQRFGLTTQLGALYAGKPTIELYPENGNLAIQDKDKTTTLGEALEAEKEVYNAKLKWFPVAKLGLWLRF